MKLFTKIFLQVICVVLLLSSGIFFYTTYRWKNQSIQNINSYENSRFQTNISKFENMLMRIKSKTQDTDDKIREKMIIYAFRQVFHDSAVLYQDGKEQYNGTKYEFDLQNIRNLTKNKHDGFENDSYCDKPLISKWQRIFALLFFQLQFYRHELSDRHLQRYYQCTKTESDTVLSGRRVYPVSGSVCWLFPVFDFAENYGTAHKAKRSGCFCGKWKL